MNRILLVEGKDDKAVLGSILFNRHMLPETFKIKEMDGIDNLMQSIPVHVKTDIETKGIVVDADFDMENRWKALKNIIRALNYDVPSLLSQEGNIIHNDELPMLGIWIMPDNSGNGMLEDFVNYLLPHDDKLMPIVDETLVSLENSNLNRYKDIHRAKAKIHTWLAWQETPGTPMGLAITKKYMDVESELCERFVKWINELFFQKEH